MPVQASKTRRGRPPGSKNKVKRNGTHALVKTRRRRARSGSTSMPDQANRIEMLSTLHALLVGFAARLGCPIPSYAAQAAVYTLIGHSTPSSPPRRGRPSRKG